MRILNKGEFLPTKDKIDMNGFSGVVFYVFLKRCVSLRAKVADASFNPLLDLYNAIVSTTLHFNVYQCFVILKFA